jgi:hypothetical protein
VANGQSKNFQVRPAPSLAKYDLWLKNGLNVLFRGKRGIGKSEKVIRKWNEYYGKGNWLYFSASTMDPWVDLIGAPKEAFDEETGKSFLKLIRPAALEFGTIKAIMFDEFNRAPPKIRNAVMELIQFKSINGFKFPELEVVWAAINPHDDDGTYNVEYLDPAEEDRFHVIVDLPYDVDMEWFRETYGDEGVSACNWWRSQDEDIREAISPRRMSYAVNMFFAGGDLSDVLPPQANVTSLVELMTRGTFKDRLLVLFKDKNDANTQKAFNNHNFFAGTQEIINSQDEYVDYFLPFIPRDALVNFYMDSVRLRRVIFTHDYNLYQSVFDPLLNSSSAFNASQIGVKNSIERWREKWLRNDGFTDAQFIDMVSNTKKNIDYVTKEEKYRDVINRFGLILHGNNELQPTQYRQMLGPMMEILHQVKRDPAYKNAVLSNIANIKKKLDYAGTDFMSILNVNLPGLRHMKIGSSFDDLVDILKTTKTI